MSWPEARRWKKFCERNQTKSSKGALDASYRDRIIGNVGGVSVFSNRTGIRCALGRGRMGRQAQERIAKEFTYCQLVFGGVAVIHAAGCFVGGRVVECLSRRIYYRRLVGDDGIFCA